MNRSAWLIAFSCLIALFNISLAPAPKRLNIIIILADDMGYSDIGCFGSEIKTPNLDALAAGGLRMTQFYNASRCCPSRASLLTGLYQHQAGVGDMVNTRAQPSYQGYLNNRCVTIAEALKAGGYRTYMAGKWHVGQERGHWPLDRGFDRYYGLIDGANSYFGNFPYRPNQKLTIALDNTPVNPPQNYYSTDAYTDYALKFITDGRPASKPFFLYLAYQTPHWPLHALPEDIQKYKGKYLQGWDKLRIQRLAKMKQLGILTKYDDLSALDKNVPSWQNLSKEEQARWDDKMAVYAAMIDRMDQNIGRLLQKLKTLHQDRNTLIMFLSDNGASNENINASGFTPEMLSASKKLASDPGSFTAYEYEGANLSTTPFRLFKHWEHEGGISTPFIANYPGVIKAGQKETRPAHILDLMATCLDFAKVKYPKTYRGNAILPTEGQTLLPLFKGQTWKGHDALFFEHEGNRAVRRGDWKIVSEYPATGWELYNIRLDRAESKNLAANNPAKVQELASLYEQWSRRAGVIPFAELPRPVAGGQ